MDRVMPWSLEKDTEGCSPTAWRPWTWRVWGSSCLKVAVESIGWKVLTKALTPREGCGYFGSPTEKTLSRLWRKPNFHFSLRDLRGAVKLLLKLFNLKTSDKEQVYCLAHCTLTLWKLPIHLISPHDIGEKLRVLPFYRQGALALFADE